MDKGSDGGGEQGVDHPPLVLGRDSSSPPTKKFQNTYLTCIQNSGGERGVPMIFVDKLL